MNKDSYKIIKFFDNSICYYLIKNNINNNKLINVKKIWYLNSIQ